MFINKYTDCILKKASVTYYESDGKKHMDGMNNLFALGMRE
ncbi:hypothetical protein J2S21_000264 [Peribacillus cavernae]|nr:hypothetical protein [Peribacillus cavernae]